MDFKPVLYDRKRPDIAIAKINETLNKLLSENIQINKNVENIVVTAETLDENYNTFKNEIQADMETTKADIVVIAGSFDSETFSDEYQSQFDLLAKALGYIKESELESWLTDHGYVPVEG